MADDELIREINEDLRRDRLEKMWREFGRHILGISVAVILVTVAIVLWQDHVRTRNAEMTAKYIDASFLLAHDKYAEAADAFQAIRKDGSGALSDMAGLRQAQALMGLGKNDEASALLKEIAGKRLANEAVRDMAALLAAAAEARKTGRMPAIDSELQDAKNPFAYTAREFAAVHLRQNGKKEEAVALLRSLAADEKAPPSLRTRAEMIAGTWGAAESK